jgi:CHAD domain-containing protein
MPDSQFLVRHRMRALARALPGVRAGDVKSIHQARVATRRLRAMLPLLERGKTGRKIERRVRDLTRALGSVRELDVALLMLAERERAGRGPDLGIDRFRQALEDERQHAYSAMLRRIERCDFDKMQEKTLVAARKRDEVHGRRPHAWAQRRAARRAERLRVAIEDAAGLYLPDRLHEVRIAAKKLRYTLEIARELGGASASRRPAAARSARGPAAWIQTLKRMQDLLGRMHDMEVLIARARALQSSAAAPDLRASAAIDRLVRALETECRHMHGRYIASRQPVLALCDAVKARGRSARAQASAA